MLDIDAALGRPSTRWDARTAYRTQYDGADKIGAGIGTALATLAPAVAIGTWGLKGHFQVGGKVRPIAAAAGLAWAGAAAYVGQDKLRKIIDDDGHFGSVASAGGMLVGGGLGYKFGGRFAPYTGLAGMVAGGVAGRMIADRFAFGEEAKTPAPSEVTTHTSFPGTAQDFVRGAGNHFVESGPMSQGISYAGWGMRQAVRDKYNAPERGGAMNGELAAIAILGGGALGTAAGIVGKSEAGVARGAQMANIATRMHTLPGAQPGMYALAGILGAATAVNEFNRFSNNGENKLAGGIAAAATVGLGVGAAKLVNRSGVFASLGGPRAAAASAVTGLLLVSALSAVRMPVSHYINDSKESWAHRANTDNGPAMVAGGIGAAGGALTGIAIAKKFIPPSLQGLPKGAILAAGGVIGAVAGGAAGAGFSANIPSTATGAIAAGTGAAALGALSFAFRRNAGSAARAALVGGTLGTLASPMFTRPKTTDTVELAPGPLTPSDDTTTVDDGASIFV